MNMQQLTRITTTNNKGKTEVNGKQSINRHMFLD